MNEYRLDRHEALAEIAAAKKEGRGANLRGANLYGANLGFADLSYADLRGANLRGANLDHVTLDGLSMDGLPSGPMAFIPTPDGWHLTIGCWEGDTDSLRVVLDGPDEDWPEARGEERARRETILRPVLDMCEAYAAAHPDIVPGLAERWNKERTND